MVRPNPPRTSPYVFDERLREDVGIECGVELFVGRAKGQKHLWFASVAKRLAWNFAHTNRMLVLQFTLI